jgi:hypothetical protein
MNKPPSPLLGLGGALFLAIPIAAWIIPEIVTGQIAAILSASLIGALSATWLFYERERRDKRNLETALYQELSDRAARCCYDYTKPWHAYRYADPSHEAMSVFRLRKFLPVHTPIYDTAGASLGLLDPRAMALLSHFHFRLSAWKRDIESFSSQPLCYELNEGEYRLMAKRLSETLVPALQALEALAPFVKEHDEIEERSISQYGRSDKSLQTWLVEVVRMAGKEASPPPQSQRSSRCGLLCLSALLPSAIGSLCGAVGGGFAGYLFATADGREQRIEKAWDRVAAYSGDARASGAGLRRAVEILSASGESLRRIYLFNAHLLGLKLQYGTDLNGARLVNADLQQADMRGAKLSGAWLSGSRLVGADLRDADLSGAFIGESNIDGQFVQAADLSGADLRGANLGGDDLNLKRVNLGNADLRGVKHLNCIKLQQGYRWADAYRELALACEQPVPKKTAQ